MQRSAVGTETWELGRLKCSPTHPEMAAEWDAAESHRLVDGPAIGTADGRSPLLAGHLASED